MVHGTNVGGRDAIHWIKLSESTNAIIQQGTISDPNFAPNNGPVMAFDRVKNQALIGASNGCPLCHPRLGFVDSSVIPGLSAVSSPVLQWNGEAAAAVTLIGPDRELAKPTHPAVAALRKLCDRLSRDFGATLKEAA